MASWRDTSSEMAQDDLDGLLNAVLPLAEQTLAKHGEMFPFGATVDNDGQITMVAADLGSGEHPPSSQVLDAMYEGVRSERDVRRAAAFVADVRANGGDAIRVELEHREGAAVVVLVAYSRARFTKKLSLGEMSAGPGRVRTWNQ